MKLQTSCKWLAMAVATMAVSFADAQDRELEIEHLSDSHTFVRVNTARKYILLPVQESAPEATINIVADTRLDQTINVRLAINKADYYVPFELSPYQGKNVILDINQTTGRETARNAREDACWKEIKTGDFDGHKFTCDSKPETTKWMDYGKDHYATVTWSNAPHGRHITLAWMSNWQYANDVPTQQFRSSNSIPCDLYLYKQNGETYLASAPSREMEALRGKAVRKGGYTVSGTKEIRNFLAGNKGTYEILLNFQPGSAGKFGCTLSNKEGEKVVFTYNMSE